MTKKINRYPPFSRKADLKDQIFRPKRQIYNLDRDDSPYLSPPLGQGEPKIMNRIVCRGNIRETPPSIPNEYAWDYLPPQSAESFKNTPLTTTGFKKWVERSSDPCDVKMTYNPRELLGKGK